MNNLENFKKSLSTTDISFLVDIDKTIDIDKRGKAYYFRIFGLNMDQITNFIDNIRNNDVFLINPFITISRTLNDPTLNLSRQFLVTNNSNPKIITNYLYDQLENAADQFEFEHEEKDYYLIFKYKKVYIDYKSFLL